MPNQKLNLSFDDAVIAQIKMRALKEKRTVSEIVEELLREYLKRPLKK